MDLFSVFFFFFAKRCDIDIQIDRFVSYWELNAFEMEGGCVRKWWDSKEVIFAFWYVKYVDMLNFIYVWRQRSFLLEWILRILLIFIKKYLSTNNGRMRKNWSVFIHQVIKLDLVIFKDYKLVIFLLWDYSNRKEIL